MSLEDNERELATRLKVILLLLFIGNVICKTLFYKI